MSSAINTQAMEEEFLEQLEYVVAGIALNNLTTEEQATKDVAAVTYKKGLDFVLNNRWQAELGEQLQKRTFVCFNHFFVPGIIENHMARRLLEKFEENTDMKSVQNFFDKGKDVQSFIRLQSAAYKKAMKTKKSGVYDDSDALPRILENIITVRIQGNQRKNINKSVNDWKKNEYVLIQERFNKGSVCINYWLAFHVCS